MKIYTKIEYQWIDNQLVEINSDFFEYEGDITLCAGGGGGGGFDGTVGGDDSTPPPDPNPPGTPTLPNPVIVTIPTPPTAVTPPPPPPAQTNTVLLRQAGVQLMGPISFGGTTQSDNGATATGNGISFSFDGLKGAYNANINQNFVNGITADASDIPNDTTVPFILYGDSGETPQPLNQNISLEKFLNTSNADKQRISEPGYGGFNLGTPPQTLNSSVSGPFSFGEVRGRVPNDPLASTGNTSNNGTKVN